MQFGLFDPTTDEGRTFLVSHEAIADIARYAPEAGKPVMTDMQLFDLHGGRVVEVAQRFLSTPGVIPIITSRMLTGS